MFSVSSDALNAPSFLWWIFVLITKVHILCRRNSSFFYHFAFHYCTQKKDGVVTMVWRMKSPCHRAICCTFIMFGTLTLSSNLGSHLFYKLCDSYGNSSCMLYEMEKYSEPTKTKLWANIQSAPLFHLINNRFFYAASVCYQYAASHYHSMKIRQHLQNYFQW